jgi:hypothetical protein
LAKRSAGQPPEPDGLAHIIILKVPPDLGASDGVGEGVGVGDGVGVGVVDVLAQPISIETLAINTTKIIKNFFIYSPS